MSAQPGPYGNAPNVPSAAQLSVQATLQGNVTTAIANFHAARAGGGGTSSYKALHAAVLAAFAALAQYNYYIYGGTKIGVGVYDEGNPAQA